MTIVFYIISYQICLMINNCWSSRSSILFICVSSCFC
nr:MAG TPA: hypothetical protein [Bacteriophage sp.]